MPIVTKIEMPIDVTYQAPEEMAQRWVDNISAAAETTNQHRQERIPDEEAFLNRIADPAEEGYRNYPCPGFISRKGLCQESITAKQAANIKRSFDKYNQAWNHMFETVDGIPAKRYKEKVARDEAQVCPGYGGTGFTVYRL